MLLLKQPVLCAGSYDRFLNLQIALIIGMQLLMCLFCSLASYIWRERSGKQRYYLGMTDYVQVTIPDTPTPVVAVNVMCLPRRDLSYAIFWSLPTRAMSSTWDLWLQPKRQCLHLLLLTATLSQPLIATL